MVIIPPVMMTDPIRRDPYRRASTKDMPDRIRAGAILIEMNSLTCEEGSISCDGWLR